METKTWATDKVFEYGITEQGNFVVLYPKKMWTRKDAKCHLELYPFAKKEDYFVEGSVYEPSHTGTHWMWFRKVNSIYSTMKLYLISQNDERGYDTYDSAVVAAASEEIARKTHPGGGDEFNSWDSSWTNDPNKVKVEYLGEAKAGTKEGVICASFNAG
jgi:hypothetical protein